jgi:fused signal recognition particle receptor
LRGSEITPELWDSLEEVLIGADAGVETTSNVLERVRAESPRQISEVRVGLRQELIAILEAPVGSGRLWGPQADGLKQRPAVVLVVGVNGTGKTTALARLAFAYQEDGLRVMAAAGDTFRAAAIEQLRNWGERLGFDVIAHQQGSDPAAVAFDALEAAQARGHDLVLVDTAGRLHNKQNLMDELSKIRRVIERQRGHGPDEVVLVLDATTGQNGLAQARAFADAVGVTSVVLTKLDGSARGGIVFAVAAELGLPVRFIGIGDGPGDLAPFDAESFVDALLGARQVAEA